MTLRSYDLNTNIKSFSRRGFLYDTSACKYYGLLDSLTVYYGGNQVRLVTDAVTTDYGHPAEYRDGAATWYEHNHDKNGNLVCDLDRGVTSIGYNILNLPEKVMLPGNHETYNIYDADGRKLRTIHIVAYDPVMLPSGETITPSDTLVRDYSGSHIYENGVLERTLTPTGYYSAANSEYCHYIKDYQGNNIAVVKADANGAPEVVSATLMYPFGGELTEMSATDRYRFGGKELDTRGGLFHYDFGARHYDPVFPAFTSVDPMAEKYPHLSPYLYCAGNPILFIDPSGKTIFHTDRNGNVLYYEDDGSEDLSVIVDSLLDEVVVTAYQRYGGGGGSTSWANAMCAFAGALIIADDVTGFGAFDDYLLPFFLGEAVANLMSSGNDTKYVQITGVNPSYDFPYDLSYISTIQQSSFYNEFNEHSKDQSKKNWDKHSRDHSSKRYGENRNNNRGE